MEILYTDKPIPEDFINSIFLAGPTPRSPQVPSWRLEALQILSELPFAGKVLVPEWSDSQFLTDDREQFEWDRQGLDNAARIVFWVPREMKTLPGLTTNVEFGRYISIASDRVFYGRPDAAESIQYLDWLYEKQTHQKPFDDLRKLLTIASESSRLC